MTDDPTRGRTAVVTGGTGALGTAVVRDLLAGGMRVHIPWVRDAEHRRLREELAAAGDRVAFREVDLTAPTAAEAYFAGIASEWGPVDILANLAGGFAFASLADTTPEMWQRMLGLNATIAFLASRAVVPGCVERGWGRVVNVAAGPALGFGAAQMAAYSASKAAVLNLTYSLAGEVTGTGVTVNAIVPTIIDTPANREAMPDADARRWLDPADIAPVIRWLVSDGARLVNGTAVRLAAAD